MFMLIIHKAYTDFQRNVVDFKDRYIYLIFKKDCIINYI